MKTLKNLTGFSTLSKKEQRTINGGRLSDCFHPCRADDTDDSEKTVE